MPTNKVAFVTLVTMVTADPGVFITAVAGVTSSSDDPNTANNVNRSTTRVVQNGPPADLVLEFDQPPTAVIAGTIVPFTVKVTNNGPSDISSATVLVPVPRNTRYLATTVSQGSDPRTPPIGKPGAVAWRPGLLTPGASATMTVSLGIAGRAGTRVFASALVTSGADDSNLENNTSTTSARVQSLGDVAIQWDPPDASGDNAPPQNVTVTPSSTGPPAKTDATAATRDGSGDVLCYNVYSSNTQPVATTPENLLTTVPPNETVYDGSAAPGGSFFTVTAQYPEGESGAANTAGTGDTPGPTIDTWKVTSTKVTATGSGFSTTVEVLFDGIPFADLSKVKKSNTKVVQKGSLVIAQTVDQYTAGGGSFLIIFRNEDGGVTTVTYTKQ